MNCICVHTMLNTHTHIHTHSRSYTQILSLFLFLSRLAVYLLIFAAFVAAFFYIATLFASYFLNGSSATFIHDMKNTHTHIYTLLPSYYVCDVNYWKSTEQIKIFIFMMIIIIIMNLVDSKISVCHEAFELIWCYVNSVKVVVCSSSGSSNSTITW